MSLHWTSGIKRASPEGNYYADSVWIVLFVCKRTVRRAYVGAYKEVRSVGGVESVDIINGGDVWIGLKHFVRAAIEERLQVLSADQCLAHTLIRRLAAMQ